MKNCFIALAVAGILTVFIQDSIHAEEEHQKKKRLEARFSYEYLNPHSDYGSWETFTLSFYNNPVRDLTYFLNLGVFDRNEGKALMGTLGAYRDWTAYLYTYTALSTATNSEYLPRVRVDNDFNVKLGPEKEVVLTAGITYVRYFDVHKDLILSTGLTYYEGKWIMSYRFFRNDSDPGDVISYSHLASIGYGKEGSRWTFADLSYGKQAYLATHLSNPEQVSQNSLSVTIRHRHWIQDSYGIILETGYLDLDEGYKKYLFVPGLFMEF